LVFLLSYDFFSVAARLLWWLGLMQKVLGATNSEESYSLKNLSEISLKPEENIHACYSNWCLFGFYLVFNGAVYTRNMSIAAFSCFLQLMKIMMGALRFYWG
jgi:hypothetical protein